MNRIRRGGFRKSLIHVVGLLDSHLHLVELFSKVGNDAFQLLDVLLVLSVLLREHGVDLLKSLVIVHTTERRAIVVQSLLIVLVVLHSRVQLQIDSHRAEYISLQLLITLLKQRIIKLDRIIQVLNLMIGSLDPDLLLGELLIHIHDF